MARYIFDTCILLHYVRGSAVATRVDQLYSPSISPNMSSASVVSVGEIRSLAYRLRWGDKKRNTLDEVLNSIPAVDINHPAIIGKFAEIDAFRMGKHPTLSLQKGDSAHSLGDNDIWIAATASILRATLLTTDRDFDFLAGVFIDVVRIDQGPV